MRGVLAAILVTLAMPGCTVLRLSVSNPVPALSKVAIVPFFNLSAERAVDGRRFAEAYFGELQKVCGFEVLPVGVTEQAIFDHKLAMAQPDDVLKLAQILKVDVVVVGAVTDYSPYYPPRIGMKVAWYSPQPWRFVQGMWMNPAAPWPPPDALLMKDEGRLHRAWRYVTSEKRFYRTAPQKVHDMVTIRGQSDPLPAAGPSPVVYQLPIVTGYPAATVCPPGTVPVVAATPCPVCPPTATPAAYMMAVPLRLTQATIMPPPPAAATPPAALAPGTPPAQMAPAPTPLALPQGPALFPTPADLWGTPPSLAGPEPPSTGEPPLLGGPPAAGEPPPIGGPLAPLGWDPRQPIMTYARMFDGADANLATALRDYVEIGADLRSGGWPAYLQRSDDFIRFSSHLMIYEMLTLHGGKITRELRFRRKR